MTDLKQAESRALELLDDSSKVREQFAEMQVNSPQDAQWATDTAKEIRKHIRSLEKERDEALTPLRTVMTKIRGWFAAPIDNLKAAEMVLKTAAAQYVERVRQEQAKALVAAADATELQAAVALSQKNPAGLHTRFTIDFEVLDESAIPREYWDLNHVAIRRTLRAGGTVPGVKMVKKPVTVLR